jgi:hypothetical protein
MAEVNFSSIQIRTLSPHGIVLDLDESLVHTFPDMETASKLGVFSDPQLRSRVYHLELTDVSISKGIGQKIHLWGIIRPHVDQFLRFCFSYFKIVGVWSAGKKEYVEAIVELLFRDIAKPHFIYTYNDCYAEESGNLIKPLDKLFHETTIGRHINRDNILCLDDRDDVCCRNPDNAVIIPRYKPKASIESLLESDLALKDLMNWLLSPKVRFSNSPVILQKDQIFKDDDYQ